MCMFASVAAAAPLNCSVSCSEALLISVGKPKPKQKGFVISQIFHFQTVVVVLFCCLFFLLFSVLTSVALWLLDLRTEQSFFSPILLIYHNVCFEYQELVPGPYVGFTVLSAGFMAFI